MKFLPHLLLFAGLFCPHLLQAIGPDAFQSEILFIDGGVERPDLLVAGVRPGVEVHMLDGDRDGLEQMADALRHRRGLSAVHVVSHAEPGRLLVGDRAVTTDGFDAAGESLEAIGASLGDGGDLLLYGCELSRGREGSEFLRILAERTRADVAASVNETGSVVLGADWVLESATGPIETARVFTSAMEETYVAGTLQFSTGQFLTGSNSTNNYSSQAIGPGDTFYGAWNYSGSGGTIKFATWNGSSWTEVPLSAITGATVAGQLTGLDNLNQLGTDSFKVDSNGDFHVALAISSSSGGVASQRGLVYGFFDVSIQNWTFRRIFLLSDPSGFKGVKNGESILLLDSSENPHIVFLWTDSNIDTEYVEHAFFNGTSWNVTGTTNADDAFTVDSLGGDLGFIGLDGAVDSSGDFHITYSRDDTTINNGDIYTVKRTGSTWGTPTEIRDLNRLTAPSLALDSSDNLHVAWTEYTPGTRTFEVKIATNASGSYVTSTALSVSEPASDFGENSFNIQLSINSAGNRFLGGFYGFYGPGPSFSVISGGLFLLTESSPGTWVSEIAEPAVSTDVITLRSMAVQADNTASLLAEFNNFTTSIRNLRYAVGVPAALGSAGGLTVTLHQDGANTRVAISGSGTTSGATNISTFTNATTTGEQWSNMSGNPFDDTTDLNNADFIFTTPIPFSPGVNITGIQIDNDPGVNPGDPDLDDFRLYVDAPLPTGFAYNIDATSTLTAALVFSALNPGTYTDDADGGTTFLGGFELVITTVPLPSSNAAPTFNDGATASLNLNENASATSINSLLDITDTDTGDPLTWSVTPSGSLGGFPLTGSSNGGTVFPTGLTYTPTSNTTGSGSFAVQISDGTDTDSITVNYTITDVNPIITANSGSIAEDASGSVLTMAATGDTNGLTWSITGGNTGSAFAINPSTGEITVANALDFETTSGYTLNVAVDDEDLDSTADDMKSVAISITDVNEAPSLSLGATSANLAEGNTPDNIVTSITVNDDALGSESLSLSGTDAGSFQINGGNLEFTATADFEFKDTFSVTINVDDTSVGATPDDSATFTLNITDVNEPPSLSLGATSGSLDENNTPNNVVTTITVNDDGLGSESLSLSGADAGSFQINGTNLEFTASANFEVQSSYSVTVEVDDTTLGSGAEDTASFTLTINDVNDAPTVDNTVADFTVIEDAADSTFNLTDIFSDLEDADSDLTYTVETNTNSSLVTPSIDAGTDILTLDYLTNQNGTVTITVRATDSGTLFVEETFTVTVSGVNDTPSVDNAVVDFTVNEDAVDSTFDLTNIFSDVEDADSDLIYTVETNTNPSLISTSVNSVTDILTLDYQLNQNGAATITVRATDSGLLFAEESFTVTVTPVNDTPTVSNAVADVLVNEDAADSAFDLTNIFSDVEDADSDLTYTVISNSNPTLVSTSIDAGTDIMTLDYQVNQNGVAEITVRAEDSGTLFIEDTFTVTVNAVNDTPSVANAVADFVVGEDAADSTFDLTNIFSDIEDADSDLTYTVETNSNPSLATASIDLGTDVLTLDYLANQNGTVTITVRATDSGPLFVEDTFTVTVTAVNDTPTVSNAVADVLVNEDAADSTFDLTNIFSDVEDADSDLIYTVETNTNPSLISTSVNSVTDILTLDYQLNQNGVAEITVRAEDSGTLFAEDTFTVTVTAVNDIPTVSNAVADFVVGEDAADSTFDLTSIFSDVEDADSDLTYTVESNSNPSLVTPSIDAGTDELTLDYQLNQFGVATITVRATDSGTLFAEETFIVTVNAVNDTPTVDNAVADVLVNEDAADSVFDLTSVFSDIEDADSDLTYTVETNTNSSLVTSSIDAGTDELTLDYQLNQFGVATLTVRATDSGTLFAEDTFIVTVNAVNDTPTVSNAVADVAVDEDAADSTFDLTDIFSDVEDADSDLSYTVETNTNPSLATASIDPGTDVLTLVYQLNQFGVTTLTVRATDSGTLFAEDTFIVTVNAVNDTPVVSNAVADFTVNEDAADSTFDLTSIFSDIEDADSDLTYTVETNTNSTLVTATADNGTDILTLDYQANQTGTAEITVRATDSGTLFAEETFIVTVIKQVDLTVTAEEDKDPVLAGNGLPGNLIHQIKVLNNGPSDATNLVIDFTQTLPTGVILDSASPGSGSETAGTWTIPALAEGAMATLTLTLSVPATVLGGTDTIITVGGVTSVTEPLTATGDDTATVETSVSSPASTGVDLETGILGNLSNSLIEQTIKVTNNNPDPVVAFRILVGGLPADVTLFNAHGTTTGGLPFVVWDQPVPAGGSAEVLMQYHRNSGLADFTPEYTIEFLTAAEATALLDPPDLGDPLAVVRFVQLADGGMLVEWASVPGKTYYIQYTSNMTTYTTVLPGITAGANRTQWIDRGPPQTESHPSDVTGLRAYRVMEAQ